MTETGPQRPNYPSWWASDHQRQVSEPELDGNVGEQHAVRDKYDWRPRAQQEADADAWGGRGPSASYAEWLAEGQAETGGAAEAEP